MSKENVKGQCNVLS